MYKIKQVADLLNVETVVIHEKLISLRDLLSPYVKRNAGVTVLSKKAVEILKAHIDLTREDLEDQTKESSLVPQVKKDADHSQDEDILEMKARISAIKQEINKLDLGLLREQEALDHYVHELSLSLDQLKKLEAQYFID